MDPENFTVSLTLTPGEALALNNALTFWRDALTLRRMKAEANGQALTEEHADRELAATQRVHGEFIRGINATAKEVREARKATAAAR